MRQLLTERLKQYVRPMFYRTFRGQRKSFDCPICGYHGPFKDKRVSRKPDLVRPDCKCPGCGAAERHRMLSLVLRDVLGEWSASRDLGDRSLLHIAPEQCLSKIVSEYCGTYHTADLFMPGVDFKEDLQQMSFPDGSYDALLISRVLMSPPDVKACVREIRRILKPGGFAIIAEAYVHETTVEYGEMRRDRSRETGMDLLDLYAEHFPAVDRYLSNRYDASYQLTNRMLRDGQPYDLYPETVRAPGYGFMDLVAVCHVPRSAES